MVTSDLPNVAQTCGYWAHPMVVCFCLAHFLRNRPAVSLLALVWKEHPFLVDWTADVSPGERCCYGV